MIKKQKKVWFIGCIKAKAVMSMFFAIAIFCFTIFLSSKTEFVASPANKATIVIDAGHGLPDGGAIGKYTNVYESELNLIYAKNLKSQLIKYGFGVVMTRNSKDGIFDKGAKNLKKSDMKNRKNIIDKSSPDMIVSIHMNSFPLESSKGAQVFYKSGNDIGMALAKSIQSQLTLLLANTKKQAKQGDYYIVNCSDVPAVLIECGFLSNKEEELLLQNKSYQTKFCYAVVCGIIAFYSQKGSGV